MAAVSERANQEREQTREEKQLEGQLNRAYGIKAAAMGLLLVGVGGLSPGYAGPAGKIGLVFGTVGHLLGARLLGGALIVVSVAEIVMRLLS